VNVDPAVQLRLLDLQVIDTAIAQLNHRRATLPELGLLAAAADRHAQVTALAVDVRTRLDDLDVEQRRLDADVDTVRSRSTRDNQRMLAGGLPAKELEGLQHEVATLARRQSTLEDELLEIMEQRENTAAELAELDSQLVAIDLERLELESKRDDQFADIDDALNRRRGERSSASTDMPGELLALYAKIAAASGGVGAAAVRQRRCEGCHLELAGSELTSVRNAAPDAIVRCDNCRRILIRTPESGL
jgi:predicted  nucleic acid-binding Zn-ribbon protein